MSSISLTGKLVSLSELSSSYRIKILKEIEEIRISAHKIPWIFKSLIQAFQKNSYEPNKKWFLVLKLKTYQYFEAYFYTKFSILNLKVIYLSDNVGEQTQR